MLFLLLLAAAAVAGFGLGASVARLTRRAGLLWTAAAGAAATLGTALLLGRLLWPSYLAPFAVLVWALGALVGTFRDVVGGALPGGARRRPGRHR